MGVHGDDGWSLSFEDTPLWQLKLRLQHTGWLQYAVPFVLATLLLPLAFAEYLAFGGAYTVFGTLAKLLVLVGAFDLFTVKYDVRPREPIPPPTKDLTDIEAIQARHSCRSFQCIKMTEAHRREILDVARISLKRKLFDRPIRLEYIDTPVKVWPAVNCSEFLVAIAPNEYSKEAIFDLGRSLELVVLHATKMGLGTLWVGPGADHESIIAALGERFDPDRDHIICVAVFGYRSWFAPLALRLMSSITSTHRLPLNKLVFRDEGCQHALPIEDERLYRTLKPAFEAVRWSPSSYNAQTTRCVAVLSDKYGSVSSGYQTGQHLKQIDFYRSKPSKYYATVALGIWMAHWETACNELGLKGRFEIDETRLEEEKAEQPPIFDISWVFDEPIQIES